MKAISIGTGQQRAIVVPGNFLSADFYRPLAEQLCSRGVSVTLLTLPGYGGEPPLAEPSWEQLADEVLSAARAVGAQLLVGHSMGSLIALLAAARAPEVVHKLVLMEPAVVAHRWVARRLARRYLRRVVNAPDRRFENYNGGMRRVAALDRFPPEAIADFEDSWRAADADTVRQLFRTLPECYPLPLSAVTMPTLVLSGAATGWRGHLLARGLCRRLPAASRRVVAGAAHWMANEADEVVASYISEFVG